MTRFLQSLSRGKRLLILSAVVALVALVILWPSNPPPVVVLRPPVRMPVSFRARVDRLVPRSSGWAWLWQIETALLGRRKTVELAPELVCVSKPSSLGLGPPGFADTNGLQVWLLDTTRFEELRARLPREPGAQVLAQSKIVSADGMQCRMFQGQTVALAGPAQQVGAALQVLAVGMQSPSTQVGFTFDCLASVRRSSTDLTAGLTFSELATNQASASGAASTSLYVRTNLNVALRVQIPDDSGVVVLQQNPHAPGGTNLGVIIRPLRIGR